MSRELLQRALEALQDLDRGFYRALKDDLRSEIAKQKEQDADLVLAYAKGYESGKEYVTNRIRRVLAGEPAPSTIDLGLFEITDKSTVANINLDDGIYRLYAVRANK
jgi:hypothetical protein